MLRRRFLSSVIFFSEAVASPIPHALFHHSSPVFSEATHTVKFLGMEKYFGKRPRILDSCPELEAQNAEENLMENDDINESEIKADPGLRKPIAEYGVNIRDRIRREYVAKGPCQPKGNIFQKTRQGKDNRSFRDAWYKDYDWLEYSEAKHAAYCFYCFLFKRGYVAPGDEAFTSCGFSNWKKALEKFKAHVGDKSSAHNKARIEYENFVNQRQSVTYVVSRGMTTKEKEYRIRLTATVDVVRFLLIQGLPFRGHDESSTSLNKGNFLELLEWYGLRNDEVGKVILKNAPGNNQMTSPSVQKDMANACAVETTLDILGELGDRHFSILVDESRDCSTKEQMAIVIRFVNKDGQIIERFLALVHVKKTTSVCLKEAIDSVFAKFKLSLSRLRGQGYDGASNMRGECNGLKALILKENPSAWYVHCFAHQLQLVCVAVCKTNQYVCDFFSYLISIVTTCGSSCKRADMIRQIEHDRLVEMIENGEIGTGRGQNQETSLKRPGDTRWGSHYVTVIRLANMWQSVTEVLENVLVDGEEYETRGKAVGLVQKMETFEFVFILMLMKHLLGVIQPLSCALQQRDQDILNAIFLIENVKESLRSFREFGWDTFLQEVNDFCGANDISITNMDDDAPKRISKRNGSNIKNYHHYRVEIFCQVVDLLTQEMENRFSEASTDLLSCMACLDPKNDFAAFNVHKLVHLATLYPKDFTSTQHTELFKQLETFVDVVRRDARLNGIEDLASLSQKIVETKKDKVFPLVYRLIELVLILPVATASVERVFSAMKFVKTDLRNRMGDEWLNDSLVVYNERSIFASVSNERILKRFQDMDTRRNQLSRLTDARAT